MGRGKNKANKEKQKRSRIFYQSNNVNQSKFSETLKQQGLRLKIQCGDGNCLFRSIGDQVYGDTNKHSELRSLVVSYLTENMEYFKMFMEDDELIEDYLNKMSIDKEWGGHQELYALSQVLNIDIVVHQVDGPKYIIKYESNDINNKMMRKGIAHVSYHGNCHYNSVRFIDDNDDLPAIEFHSLNNLECNDLVKSIMKAVPWLTTRHAELALEMNNNDVDNSIDFLISNSDTISQLIENENNNDNINSSNNDDDKINSSNDDKISNSNDDKISNSNHKIDNNNHSNHKIDNNNHNSDNNSNNIFTKTNSKKTVPLSKKEERKLKKKGNSNNNNNNNNNNNTNNNDNDVSITKSLSEIYL